MINGQAIEKYIKMLIDQNITRFVIYPYGVNGKSIHQVLKINLILSRSVL